MDVTVTILNLWNDGWIGLNLHLRLTKNGCSSLGYIGALSGRRGGDGGVEGCVTRGLIECDNVIRRNALPQYVPGSKKTQLARGGGAKDTTRQTKQTYSQKEKRTRHMGWLQSTVLTGTLRISRPDWSSNLGPLPRPPIRRGLGLAACCGIFVICHG